VRYRVRDAILSEVLGEDYYLPEDRDWAEDVEGGWRVHMEDAQASKLVAVIRDEEGNVVFERELPVRGGRLVADVYYGDYGGEGAAIGGAAGSMIPGLTVGLRTRRVGLGLLAALIGGVMGAGVGYAVGKERRGWKVRTY